MKWELSDKALHSDFRRKVEAMSGQKLGNCYQCGKCSGGCPVEADLEASPTEIIRRVQLGLEDEALKSETIWHCAACGTCNGRCPMGIDIVSIMDALRALAGTKNLPPGGARVWAFYRSFLDCVRNFGRLSEIGLMGGYNINSGRLMTNVIKAPWFFLKGKVGIVPHTVRRTDRLERIFQRIEEIEG